MLKRARLVAAITLAFLAAGCGSFAPPALGRLNEQSTLEEVRAVAEADLRSRAWNVPGWYLRSIHITPEIAHNVFTGNRWGVYTFIYTGLMAALGTFVLFFFIYMATIKGFEAAYFWVVTGLSLLAIPVLSFASSAISGQGLPWHFSMFCIFVLGTIAPALFVAFRGVPALAGALIEPMADASRRRTARAEQQRSRRAQAEAEREAVAQRKSRDQQRNARDREESVHERLRNIEVAVGMLYRCAPDERADMERALLISVTALTGYEKVIKADPHAVTNIRNVLQTLDRIKYDRNEMVYLKLASLVR